MRDLFAEQLRREKVTFVFAYGYGQDQMGDEPKPSALIVSKPYDRESLSAAIAATLRQRLRTTKPETIERL